MLIDLNDPKNAASRGDVPEAVRYLVEVPYCVGVLEPPIIRCHPLGSFFENPFAGKGFATADDVAGNKVEHFRPATAAEIAANCPEKPLTFGRYVVEGDKAYRLLEENEHANESDQFRDYDNEWFAVIAPGPIFADDVGEFRRPLPSTPATYALLQAAWVEHFRVKVGTRVKVARTWPEKGDLSFIHPYPALLALIGREFVVDELLGHGVLLGPCRHIFPFHVLEVLPEPAEARERAVETAHADPDDRPFFVDERAGCIGIRERAKTDPGYQGLHHDTKGVVWYRHGERNGSEWVVDSRHVDEANRLCAQMNAGAAKANELAAIRTKNASLAATVAGMREALPVNDELAEAVALLETICGQEIQKQAGLDPGGRSTMELAEAALALINTALAAGKGESDE